MEGANLFCEYPACGSFASCFGIKGTTKVKSCHKHMASLLEKGMTVCDLAAFPFVFNLADLSAFEAQKAVLSRAIGNLDALEAKCDADWRQCLLYLESCKKSVLEVLERSFEEVRLQTQRRYEAVKQSLCERRTAVTESLRHCEQSESALARELTFIPTFLKLTGLECAYGVASAVLGSYVLLWEETDTALTYSDESQRQQTIAALASEIHEQLARGEIALEAVERARTLGHREDVVEAALRRKQAEDAVRLESLFCFTVDETCVEKTVAALLALGLEEKESRRFDESRRWLQSAWDLLQRHFISSRSVAAVGLPLSAVLSKFLARYREAQDVLTVVYLVETRGKPLSEDAVLAQNALAETHFNTGDYSKCAALCSSSLQTLRSLSHSADLHWTALFYWVFSLASLGQEVKAVVEEWGAEAADSEKSELLRTCVQAHYEAEQGRPAEALLQEAKVQQRCSVSAFCVGLLGGLCSDRGQLELARQYYLMALDLYEGAGPQCLDAANIYVNLGRIQAAAKQLAEATENYERASRIYSALAPQSVDTADTLHELASLLKKRKKYAQAEEHFKLARSIYSAQAPDSAAAAQNLRALGYLLKAREKHEEAADCLDAARTAFSRLQLKVEAEEVEKTLALLRIHLTRPSQPR